RRAQRGQEVVEQPEAPCAPAHQLLGVLDELVGEVEQRSQRGGRGHGLARAPHDLGACAQAAREGLDQGGLAPAGLAADEHESARASAARFGVLTEASQEVLALQQPGGAHGPADVSSRSALAPRCAIASPLAPGRGDALPTPPWTSARWAVTGPGGTSG